jgi:hypothetical protein
MLFLVGSPVCETTGYAIKTDHLVGVTPTPATTLKDPTQAKGLYDVLCGTSFEQIVKALEKDGRALMNLGGFTGLLGLPLLSLPSPIFSRTSIQVRVVSERQQRERTAVGSRYLRLRP